MLGGAAALALYLVAVIPSLSALGRVDNDNFNHWIKVNFAFGGNAVDTSVLSPFQGMAGLAQPLAVRLYLPYLLAYLIDPSHMNAVVTVVCASLMPVEVFVLPVALGARLSDNGSDCREDCCNEIFPLLWVFLLSRMEIWTKKTSSCQCPTQLGDIKLNLE